MGSIIVITGIKDSSSIIYYTFGFLWGEKCMYIFVFRLKNSTVHRIRVSHDKIHRKSQFLYIAQYSTADLANPIWNQCLKNPQYDLR